MKIKLSSKQNRILFLILSLGLIYQFISLYNAYSPTIKIIRTDIGQPAIWRGAAFSHSNELADFVIFLNQRIPTNARVILPPGNTGPAQITKPPYMQYFLFPREIHNCTLSHQDCVEKFIDTDWYMIVTNSELYPTNTTNNHLIMFNDSWGVYLPPNHIDPPNPSNSIPFSSLVSIITSLIFPIFFILGITYFGFVLVHTMYSELSSGIKISLGFGIGVGIFSFLQFLFLLNNFFSPKNAIIISTIIILIFVGAVHRNKKYPKINHENLKMIISPWNLLFAFLGVTTAIIAVGKGYQHSDEIIIWATKGYGISLYGLPKGSSDWGTLTTHYPLNIPILIATFKNIFSENLPESKLIFVGYYFFLITAIFNFLKEKISTNFAGLLSATIATMPMIFFHGTRAYANLPATYYFVIAILLISQSAQLSSNKGFWLTGIFFSLASWTRPELSLISWSLIIFTILFRYLLNKKNFKISQFFPLFLPSLIYALIWIVSKPLVYTRPGFTSGYVINALKSVFSGNINFNEARYIFQYTFNSLLDISNWGYSFWIIAIIFIFTLFSKKIKFANSFIFLSGTLVIILIMGSYFLTSYNEGNDISWWVTSGFNRMIFPGVILLFLSLSEILPRNQKVKG